MKNREIRENESILNEMLKTCRFNYMMKNEKYAKSFRSESGIHYKISIHALLSEH